MAEYTYEDIIIDPTSEEAKNAIGEGCYFGSNPKTVLDFANCNEKKFLRVLECIKPEEDNPFYDYNYGFPCIIPKKEEPKPKPKYVPFENVTEFLDAYRNTPDCLPEEVSYLSHNGIWLKDNEIDAYCMVTEIWDMGIVIGNKNITIGETTVFNDITSWDELLEDCTFLDGTPCGKEVK